MVRTGELMVIIRAQDFASRTVHKVAGEIAGMQRMQRLQARAQMKHIPIMRQEAKLMEQIATQHRALSRAAAASGNATYGWTKAGRAQAAVLNDLNQKLFRLRQHMGGIPASMQGMRGVTSEIDRFANSVKKLEAERLHRIGTAMSGMGRTMQLFGAIGTVAFGAAANSFAKFSASAATAGTQMRNLGAPMQQAVDRSKELQAAILDMSLVFPISAQDMTEAAYDIFSSMNLMHNGVMDVNAGLHLLAVANKAAVAGQVDLAEATNAMIVALNIFDPQLRDVQGTMNEVFNIVRFGKIHLDDLSHVFTQFASAAHSGGMSLKEVGAAFATLTLFTDPGKASAGLGRLVELLRVPDFRKGLKSLTGIDTIMPTTGKMKPLLDLFQEIAQARPDLVASRKAAIDFTLELTKASGLTKKGIQGTVQYRRAFEGLITHMDTFADTTKNIRANTDEMNRAFQARMTDPGVQWQLFINRMKALAIVIGQAVLPVFNRLGRWIGGIVVFIKNMNNGFGGTILRLAAWVAVGTLVTGVFLSMSGSILQLTATLGLLRLAAKAAGESFVLMRTLMIASGIGAIIVASGVAAVLVMKHWNAVRAFFQAFMETLKNDWGSTMTQMAGLTLKGVAAILNPLYQLEKRIPGVGRFAKFLGPLNLATAGLEKSGDALMNSADGFGQFWERYRRIVKQLGKDGKGGTDWLKDFPSLIKKFDNRMLSDAYKKWADSVGKSTGDVAQMAKDHVQAVKQATDNMQQTIKTATTNLMNQYQTLQQQNQTALGGLFQGPTMTGILGNVFKNINDNLRQFGVQIRVPFNILKQDLNQSVQYFKRWRNDIAQLVKRGVPYEMISELQAMGPEGIPIIEGLLAAPRGQFRAIVKTYKQGQALTDKATKEDMARKLKYWESFGKDAAWATIMGIIDNPKNAAIQKMYENYVKTTYGSILQKTFQDDVAEYMKNAIAMAQAQAAQADIKPSQMPGLFASAGGKPTFAQQLVRQQNQAQRTITRLMNFYGPLSPEQREELARARRRRRMATYERAALPTVRREMAAQRGNLYYNISYDGDKITIRADGASVASVTRALAKKHFKQKHRRGKGTTAKVYNKPGGG
jgi:TP901 family phage tail tape measure protein